ncbi:unnamed protein product [Rodentolepis nana]|uniref:FLYWCH-type domain-containing protein n=1 Tax=Rodentolepis nana TaxID=102285 RepID=A0A0R3T1P6_RODNA|nr:unnamed protein product [Rodentolepis nana]
MCDRYFPNFLSFETALLRLEQRTGMSFTIRVSKKIKEPYDDAVRFRYRRMRYICSLGGSSRTTLAKRTHKCGCPVYFEVVLKPTGLKVSKYSMFHSHAVSPDCVVSSDERGVLTPEEEEFVCSLISENADNQRIRKLVRGKYGKVICMKDLNRLKLKNRNVKLEALC